MGVFHAVDALGVVLVLRSWVVGQHGHQALAMFHRDFFEQFIREIHFQQVFRRFGGKSADGVGMGLSDKGACLNGLGDQPAAEETLADLRSLIDGCWHSKNALARNLQDGLLLLEADLCLQQGRLPEIKPLEEIYERCAYNLRRFEIDRLLALRAMAVGNKEEAKRHLSVLADNGGKTRYAAWACAQLNGAK